METNTQSRGVALVTGAGTGIGAACCRALAKSGFRIGIQTWWKTMEESRALLEEIGGNGFLIDADLTDIDQVEKMVNDIKETEGSVDVLVNCAGISINADINSMKIEQFDAQRAMLRGTWYLTKRVVRLFMLRKNFGRIINISSVVGHMGNPGQIPYTMEKAALDAFSKSLSKELAGRNITVNSVAPGFIESPMTGELPQEVRDRMLSAVTLGRMGTPEDIADVVDFLATRANYITGTVIHVNGGLYGG